MGKELKDFPYADELIEIAMTYYRACDREYNGKSWSQGLTYRSRNTPMSASCESRQGVKDSVWVAFGKRHYKAIDCSTFINLCLRGIKYEDSPYESNCRFELFRDNLLQKNREVSWAIVPTKSDYTKAREASNIAKYFYKKGWLVDLDTIGDASNDFKGLKKGDLIFYAKKNSDGSYKEKTRFKHISHVSIVYGYSKTYNKKAVIESTNVTTKEHTLKSGRKVNAGIRIKSVANNYEDDIVMVVRLQV